jgi:ornithine cyclodeaminase/alanine dehydrogenase-like protein (mu-crystallin family)
MSGDSGEPLVTIDGHRLTLWRTAAASALAAKYLAHEGATHLLLIGAGALAPYLARAHAAVRPIKKVSIWNRTPERAKALAHELSGETFKTEIVSAVETGARAADIVTCITLSQTPVLEGEWLKAGAHVDLVGAFRPNAREADDAAVKRARIYVDTRRGALKEAGDLVIPIAAGIIKESDVQGDLFDLCRGQAKGRVTPEEITLFKSVGTAIEDLAAAMLVWKKLV